MLTLLAGPAAKGPDAARAPKMLASLLGSLISLATTPYGRLDECGRMAVVYGILLMATVHTNVVCKDGDAVANIASLLSTLALSGVVQWDEPGWLDDVVSSGDPMRLAAATARCHAAVVEEAQRTRRRAHRLRRLLETDPTTIAAALRWKAKHGGTRAAHGDEEAAEDDDHSVSSATVASLPESLATLATAEGGDSGERQLERCNMFSPAALRHSALAALAIVFAQCRHRGSPGLRAAFLSSGALDAVLSVAYYSFSEDFVQQHSEKESLSTGLLGLGHHNHRRDDRSASGTESVASAESLRVAYQASQANAAAEASARAADAAKTMPTLAAQAHAHLAAAALLSRASASAEERGTAGQPPRSGGAGADRSVAGKMRLLSELPGDWRSRVLNWRTAQMAEAIVSQLDGGDASQLQRSRIARAAGARKLGVIAKGCQPPADLTRRRSSAGVLTAVATAATVPEALPDHEWHHPFRLLEAWREGASAAHALVAKLRSPASAHFASVDAPLEDLVREKFACETALDGVSVALKRDARHARDASMDKGNSLRERLAAAVAGARIESVTGTRASQVAQQRAMGLMGRAAGTRALVSMGAGEGDLASRLTAQIVGFADARANAEKKASAKVESRMAFRKQGDESDDDDDELNDDDADNGSLGDENVSMLSGASMASSATSKSRKLKKRLAAEAAAAAAAAAAETVISLEDLRKGKVGRLESELERRQRVAAESKHALLFREAILEAREVLEAERLTMINEDKRSRKVAQAAAIEASRRHQDAAQTRAMAQLRLAREIANEQRRGETDLDLAAKGHFKSLAEEDAAKDAAARTEAKRRAAEEALRLVDIRAEVAAEKAAREAAKAEEAAAAAFKQRRKDEAAALKVAVRTWRKARALHDRVGVAFRAKTDVAGRLSRGGFKLIEGELRWRDEDLSQGSWPAGDPRHAKDSHPLLKSLLTPGTVKPWKWSEAQCPAPPEGMQPETPLLEPGGDDFDGGKVLEIVPAERALSTEPSTLSWAQGESY